MAKSGDLTIHPTIGHISAGFQSEHIVHSRVSCDTQGYSGVAITVERDEEVVIPQTTLTLEEGWHLYTMLRGLFYKTRQEERQLHQNKHNTD